MDTTTQALHDVNNFPTLTLTPQSLAYLKETRKWTNFLSVLGFIFVGLIALGGIFIGSILSLFNASMMNGGMPFPSMLFSIIYFLMAALYFFPTLYLYRFSTKLKFALVNNDSTELTESLGNLKSVFKFWGITSIVVICVYALIFVIAIIFALTMRH